jgi:hypothetical protein
MASIPDGPEWTRLRDVITRALKKNRKDRYPDAGAMRAGLELALKDLGESADWTPPPSREPLQGESWESREITASPLPPSRPHCILCEREVTEDGVPVGPRLDPKLRLEYGIVCSKCKARRSEGSD